MHTSLDCAFGVPTLAGDMVLCSRTRHFTLTMAVSTGIYACLAWRFKRSFLTNLSAKPRKRVAKLCLSQAPRGFGVCYHGLPSFLTRSTCLKTAKLRRLTGRQVYRLVLANLMLRGNLRWTNAPSKEE